MFLVRSSRHSRGWQQLRTWQQSPIESSHLWFSMILSEPFFSSYYIIGCSPTFYVIFFTFQLPIRFNHFELLQSSPRRKSRRPMRARIFMSRRDDKFILIDCLLNYWSSRTGISGDFGAMFSGRGGSPRKMGRRNIGRGARKDLTLNGMKSGEWNGGTSSGRMKCGLKLSGNISKGKKGGTPGGRSSGWIGAGFPGKKSYGTKGETPGGGIGKRR